MGRWRKQAIHAVLNPVFWLAMQVMHKVRAPLQHHFAVVRASNKNRVMADMICGKADAILGELSDLANGNAGCWATSIALSLRSVPEDPIDPLPGNVELSDLIELGVSLVFHHHAAYTRRICDDLKRLPYALFWFACAAPQTACGVRQRLAKALLAAAPETLEINAQKIRLLCAEDLEQCAAHGTAGPLLYSLVLSWAASAKSDVAINEGHNSLIKAIAQRCRNIGLPLLSARANCKKELKVGVRGAPQKWSAVKRDALAMVQARLNESFGLCQNWALWHWQCVQRQL